MRLLAVILLLAAPAFGQVGESGGGIADLCADTSPQLCGELDPNGNRIQDQAGDVVFEDAVVILKSGGVPDDDQVKIEHTGSRALYTVTDEHRFYASSGRLYTFWGTPAIIQNHGAFGFEIRGEGIFAKFAAGFGPLHTDTNTLLYSCGADCIGLKAGNVGVIQAEAEGPKLGPAGNECQIFAKLALAPTGSACDKYYDTDVNEWCCHNGTNWFQCDDNVTACS